MARKKIRERYALADILYIIALMSRGGPPEDFVPYEADIKLKRDEHGWYLEVSWTP